MKLDTFTQSNTISKIFLAHGYTECSTILDPLCLILLEQTFFMPPTPKIAILRLNFDLGVIFSYLREDFCKNESTVGK